MVREQTCTCCHQMDQCLRQAFSTFDLLLSSDEWIQTILSWWNTAQQCRLGLFQDSHFAGDLEDSKCTSSGTLCIFGSHTFVPTSWMCKKQTSVSHSSTEAEIISKDTGLRMGGIPALDLWDLVTSLNKSKERVQGDSLRNTPSNKHTQNQTKTPIQHDILELSKVDYVEREVFSFWCNDLCFWGNRSSD